MKVSRVAVLLFAIAVVASHADETNLTLTVDDVIYSNVTFGTVTPLAVSIRHKTGATTIPLAKLPPDLQKRFGYDPERAAVERNRLLEQKKKRESEALQQQRLRQEEGQRKIQGYREANAGDQIKVIPYVGDETPLQKIMAEPVAANGKTFIVCGVASLENYYNYNYADDTATYYSLKFWQLGPDLNGTERLTVYASRRFAKPLADSLTDAQAGGKSGRFVRLKIAITPRSFSYGQFNENAELVDWQLLNPDKASWTHWATSSAR